MVWITKQIPELTGTERRTVHDEDIVDAPVWKKIHAVAEKYEEDIESIVFNASKETRDELVYKDLEEQIQTGNLNLDVIPWATYILILQGINTIYLSEFVDAAKATKIHLPPKLRGFEFDKEDENTIETIETRNQETITQFVNESKYAVNNRMKDVYNKGVYPYLAARYLSEHIGLTRRQSQAVENFRQKRMEDGKTQEVATKEAREYAKRSREYRAVRASATESMKAANQGYLEVVNQGVRAGVIADSLVRKRWITTPDDRLCEHCAPMHGQTQRLNRYFTGTLGQVLTPPYHPLCRCATSITTV